MRFVVPLDRGEVRAQARASLLSEWMTEWLGTAVEVVVAPSYEDLALAIEREEVDLAWAPPAICARVRHRARAIVVPVRWGKISCRAAILVRASSRFRAVEDLRGARASWVDPLSTSGCLLALAALRTARVTIGPQRFAGSYRAALLDVIEGKADVTSIFLPSDSVTALDGELTELAGRDAASLRVLALTEPAPYDGLVITRRAPDPARLEKELLRLEIAGGRPAMLLEICRAEGFVRANLADYNLFDAINPAAR